ncbi:TBRG1 regulator, partial [Pterocles burchelli]|nr:TBRG1 regulator [Pterocles burchelli]
TGSRTLGSRSTGSRDGASDGAWSTASRDWPRDDDSRSTAPRDDPRDDPTPNGANPDLPPAAILEPPEDPSSPTAPPAAILSPAPRRRGAAVTLPLTLGPLTVHSLGVAGAAAGLPVGFRSSRLLAAGGRCRAGRRRRFVCRVAAGPRCEVEDDTGRVLAAGATPDVCHARLLRALGEAGGRPRGTVTSPPPGAGDEFFGLSHPAVRRLLCGDAGAFVPPEDDDDD